LNKEILKLAIPNILSNISIPLLSTVDTVLMGHLSAAHLGAVGIGAMIFNFLYWNFGFLRMGTTGLTAQAYGRDDKVDIVGTLAKATIVSLVIAILLLGFSKPLFFLAAQLMNVIPGQEELVGMYFGIRIWAAPATLFLYVIMGWFFGMQNAVYPLIITILINAVNIGLSAFFVISLGWGVEGVAWGTVIAQYSGVCFGLIFLVYKYSSYLTTISKDYLRKLRGYRAFLRMNSDIFIRTICLSVAFAFLHSKSSVFGEVVLAANIVLLQFLNWMSYGIDGFAFASESLVGKYKGAKNETKLLMAIKMCMVWGFIFAVFYSFIYFSFGESLIRLFTDQTEVINFAKLLIPWMWFIPLIAFASYIWDGIFIGLIATKAMRNSMILSFLIYLLSYYISVKAMGYHSIWFALSIFLIARGVIQTFIYIREGTEMK
jgi:MATE family multidrug resistance protein